AVPSGGPAGIPFDLGPPPRLGNPATDAAYKSQAVEVIRDSSLLDSTSDATMDISPAAIGGNELGTNNGHGRTLNPVTNQPYSAEVVRRGDFYRSIAEFWADGPNSETPPGHWNVLANSVSDQLAPNLRLGGTGPGLIEVITPAKTAPGGSMAGLRGHEGKIAIRSWQRNPTDPRNPLSSHVGWILGTTWVPYQLATFVTPSFQGYISGHSTFSRAAAEVLAGITGSPYFPGGLAEWTVKEGALRFENGPSADVVLEWATYYDAADQAGDRKSTRL